MVEHRIPGRDLVSSFPDRLCMANTPTNMTGLFFGSSLCVTCTIFLLHFLYATGGRKLVDETMADLEIRQIAVRIAFVPMCAVAGMPCPP